MLCMTQGVGPSIAISFSVYETLRSFWQSQRWILHVFVDYWVLRHNLCDVVFANYCFMHLGCNNMFIFSSGIRPNDSTIMVSLACGSLSGIASSTGELSEISSIYHYMMHWMDTWVIGAMYLDSLPTLIWLEPVAATFSYPSFNARLQIS